MTADLILANATGFRRSSRMLASAVLAIVILGAVQTTAAFLHFAQLTNLTQGDQLAQALTYDADLLAGSVTAADTQIQTAYAAAIAAQRELEAQSRAGDDESGIAVCGPRCQGAINTRRQIETHFAALAIAIPDRSAALSVGSAMAAYAQLAPRIDALKTKSGLYLKMCQMLQDHTCHDMSSTVTENPAYLRLQRSFAGDQVVDRQTLVLWQVDRDFAALRNGTFSTRLALLGVFVLLLPFCELYLVMCIRLSLLGTRLADQAQLEALRLQETALDEQMDIEARIATKRAFHAAMENAAAQEMQSDTREPAHSLMA